MKSSVRCFIELLKDGHPVFRLQSNFVCSAILAHAQEKHVKCPANKLIIDKNAGGEGRASERNRPLRIKLIISG